MERSKDTDASHQGSAGDESHLQFSSLTRHIAVVFDHDGRRKIEAGVAFCLYSHDINLRLYAAAQ